MPLLEEVIELAENVGLTIEVKRSHTVDTLLHLADLVEHRAADRAVVTAQSHDIMKTLRKMLPDDVLTGFSGTEVKRFFYLNRIGLACFASLPGNVFQVPDAIRKNGKVSFNVVTPGFIRAAHKRGKVVQVWTINDPAQMNMLMDMGVNGITTDYPGILNEVLESRKNRGVPVN